MKTPRDHDFRFRLEIGDATVAAFSEVSVEFPIEAIDYREGDDDIRVRKLTGLRKYANITLKRGYTSSSALAKWYADLHDGARRRRDVVIRVLDESGKAETARFVITGAWPVKYDPSDLNAKGNEAIIELLELANEGIERVK